MLIRGGGVPRRYLAYAVPQNGPAAPELRRRCAWLHHGRGPHSPTEYKVAGAIFSAPVARLRSDQSVITVEVVDWECSASRLALTRARSAASALTRPRSQSALLTITSAETADAWHKNPSYPHGLTRNAPYKGPPALRRTRGGRSAPRGSLLWTTWTSPEATSVGQDSIGETAQSGSGFNRR